jgi:hypothetical protein
MRNTQPHWASQYVGNKWVALGRGPATFDCWGLCWWIEKRHFAREMDPMIINPLDLDVVSKTTETMLLGGDWVKLQTPKDGAIVALSKNNKINHVGVFLDLDTGVIIHAMAKQGVLCQKLNTMPSLGFSTIEFYFHKSWAA